MTINEETPVEQEPARPFSSMYGNDPAKVYELIRNSALETHYQMLDRSHKKEEEPKFAY